MLQAMGILMIVLLHDVCLVWAGFTIASLYLSVNGSGSHAKLNQALEVYGNPALGNLAHLASQR